MEAIAAEFIALLAILILMLALYGMLFPRRLLKFVGHLIDSGVGWAVAVGVRVVFGVALILSAPLSLWPLIFQVVGILAIFAALVILLIGPRTVLSLIAWVEKRSDAVLRSWLLLAVGFGLLLIYGIHPAFV
jgi:hypothetical protein